MSEHLEQRDVVGHLQTAAKELIAAARDALDLADEVVSDRIRFASLLARGKADKCGADHDGDPKVERIEVSRDE